MGWRICSHLPVGEHRYVYSNRTHPVGLVMDETDPSIYFECDLGPDVMLTLLYLDDAGTRIGHCVVGQMRNVPLQPPCGTTQVRAGIRISGPGETVVRRVAKGQVHERSSGVLPLSRSVILTNVYPSYDNLYRNGFVHARGRTYARTGLGAEVFTHGRSVMPRFREFDGVDVSALAPEHLTEALGAPGIERVMVHFLDPTMWAALSQITDKPVFVWVHGAEVQPWWRREYNYQSEDQLNAAKAETTERLEFWRHVVGAIPDNMHFVFVSQYFAEEVFSDLGMRLPDDRYSIIHNPVDTEIFDYVPKAPEQRFRVLSVRPYASRKYANDLSVEAVLLLSVRPGFDRLHFRFVGDGPLFDETLEPIRHLSNVEIVRGFLTHPEIAELHKDYGICLTPTRMDAQGVSRDEAMASGLVPVTTRVAAVPEFVDEECGFLAPLEDAEQLAEAIWTLAGDPERFQVMSRAAAARVRRQSGSQVVVPQELGLIRGRAAG